MNLENRIGVAIRTIAASAYAQPGIIPISRLNAELAATLFCGAVFVISFSNRRRNPQNRLEAVGGRLTIDAAPGHGTRISGRLPLD